MIIRSFYTLSKFLAAAIFLATPATAADITWIDQARGDIDAKIDKLFVKPFNAEHKDIDLKITRQENQEDAVRMSVQARNAPDILQLNAASEVANLARANLLVPLDDYAAKFGWADKIQPWALESGLVDGKLYSLPLTYESIILYFNKDTLAELGIEAPKTLADVKAACAAAKAAGIVCLANNTGGRTSRGEWFLTWHLNANAGPKAVQDVLTGKAEAKVLGDSISQNIDWIKNGWYSGRQDLYLSLAADDAWAQMAAGKALMRVSGSWELSRINRFCKKTCDWAMMPSLRDGVDQVFPLGVGETLSISADSDNPDAAAEVLNALFSNPKRSAKILEAIDFETWLVPVGWSADNFSDATDPRLVRFIVDMADKSRDGKIGYTTWTFFPPKTRNYLFETLETVLVGGTDVGAFIKGIQPLLDSEMDLVPPLPNPR